MDRKTYKVIITLLLLVIGWGYFYRPKPIITPSEPKWVHDTVTIRDTTLIPQQIDTLETPKWFVDSIALKSALNSLDSLKIENKILKDMRDYYTKKTYSDTVKNDSLAFIHITESISKNRILNRSVIYRNNYHPKPLLIDRTGVFGYSTIGFESVKAGVRIDLNHKINYMIDYDLLRGTISLGVELRLW